MNADEVSSRRTDITVTLHADVLRQAREQLARRHTETAPLDNTAAFTPEHLLQLDISGFPRLIVHIERDSVLGRADTHSDYRPEVDLSPYGAQRLGISRRHALLRVSGGVLYLADLNSRNGTLLNDHRLAPHTFHALRPHDVLTVGTLRLSLLFAHGRPS